MTVLQVAVGVVKNAAGQILISLRDEKLHQGGLWEFPGGKVEVGESIEQALRRELQEELALDVLSATPLITIRHDYGDRRVQLHVFLVEQFSGTPKHSQQQVCQWVAVENLKQYAFPAANQPIITAIQLPSYYAILDDADESTILHNLKNMLAQGIRLFQVRFKRLSGQSVLSFMAQAKPLCEKYQALLLMNSAVAYVGQADGIHLTSHHLMALEQRPDNYAWVAASCHNLTELHHAEAIGVDFIVLAPVLPTKTHSNVIPLGWHQFSELVAQARVPVYALGGLATSDLTLARQAGAQGIAAIRAFL